MANQDNEHLMEMRRMMDLTQEMKLDEDSMIGELVNLSMFDLYYYL